MAKATEVRFKCESCGKSHAWRPQLSNKKAKCSCGHVMRVPAGPTGLAVKTSKSSKDGMLALDDEEAVVEPSKDCAHSASTVTPWRWRSLYLAGGLIGLTSLYLLITNAQLLAWSLGGLMVSALMVCLGLWLRPESLD